MGDNNCTHPPENVTWSYKLPGGVVTLIEGLLHGTCDLCGGVVMREAHFTKPCPECASSKHSNCDGTTWSNQLDRLVACPCTLTDYHPQPLPDRSTN